MKNYSILNIFISNPTFSRVGNSLKTMDSTDSIVNMEKPIVLYPPSYVYIQGGLAGLVHLGGTALREIWYLYLDCPEARGARAYTGETIFCAL